MHDQSLLNSLTKLISEERNAKSMHLDQLSALDIVTLMNQEDNTVAQAIEKILPDIAQTITQVVKAFQQGGRLIYIGAGTSGRLGVLDASECPPTFGVADTMVVGIIAGGAKALQSAVEGAEDSELMGEHDLKQIDLNHKDIVIGIAVSGRTPYVIGALNYAKRTGCVTVALSCNPTSIIAQQADIAISPIVGPEVLTGSTRLKSGTAQKLVLNMVSTASMVLIGKTYQNLMVDVKATNKKLIARAIRIVVQATNCLPQEAQARLVETQFDVKLAILMQLTQLDIDSARRLLKQKQGFLGVALTTASADV
ncbi:N-acetylmuramic acid 6-phosphate etherase [Utexia brackfieldae]|uniref:N-acetylmuramic acid 6-phosphate etherase n=1 Tax=Utexia brackfieldae TaxID=3074108 RepID=UPI00370D76A9